MDEEWALGESRRVFNAHRNLSLLCRDGTSLAFARKEFAAPSFLCPDMALALGELARPDVPTSDVLWLCRTDAESPGVALPAARAGVVRIDWLEEPATPLRAHNQAPSWQL